MSLSLESAVHVTADRRNPPGYDQELLDYHRDLLAPYAVPLREDLLRAGRNVSFRDLAEQLIAQVAAPPVPPGPRPAAPRPDLLILAHALPDYHPLTTVAARANLLLGGGARSFAVSEQGLRAPFTALRLGLAYARSGRCGQLALFVLEQSTLPYELFGAADLPLVDSGVLLMLGAAGTLAAAVSPRVPPGGLAGALRNAATGLPDDRVLVVAGPGTDAAQIDASGLPARRVGPGSYCTSVWLELARHWRTWAAGHAAIVLCDTDPGSGHSSVATLRQTVHSTDPPAGRPSSGSRS
jgi:hypothetical protein